MWKRDEWAVFAISFIFIALITKTHYGSANDTSRLAEIQSIVEEHTFAIDNSAFINKTIDKVFIAGQFYSDKPPLSFLIGVPIYSIMHMSGITLFAYPRLTYYAITLFTVGLSISIMLAFFFKLLAEYKISKRCRLLYTSILFLGTLLLPYSVTFNNQGPAAGLLFIGYYFVRKSEKTPALVLAGIAAGLGAAVELVSGPIFVVIFAFQLLFRQGMKKALLFGVIASVPTIAHVLINQAISGSVVPFNLRADYWQYPGSSFSNGQVSGLVHQSFSTNYLFNLTFGGNGFFSYSPVLIFSFIALITAVPNIKRLRTDAALIGCGMLAVFLFYLLRTNTDGCSYGFRYGVPLIPLLFSFTPLLLEMKKTRLFKCLKLLFLLTAGISFFFALVGVMNPWTCKTLVQFIMGPFIELLTSIAHNTISVYRI